jgi:hypothetical protein
MNGQQFNQALKDALQSTEWLAARPAPGGDYLLMSVSQQNQVTAQKKRKSLLAAVENSATSFSERAAAAKAFAVALRSYELNTGISTEDQKRQMRSTAAELVSLAHPYFEAERQAREALIQPPGIPASGNEPPPQRADHPHSPNPPSFPSSLGGVGLTRPSRWF